MHELGQVLQDGLHFYRRCIVTSVPAPAVTNHVVSPKAGILWISHEQHWSGLHGRRHRFGILPVFGEKRFE